MKLFQKEKIEEKAEVKPEEPSLHEMNKTELANLQRQVSLLHGEIITTLHIVKKRQLQERRAKILPRINELKCKINEYEELEYQKKLPALIREHLLFIYFATNGRRLPISQKDLTVTLKYKPCGHQRTVNLADFLKNKNTSEPTRVAFERWQRLLTTDETYNGHINCSKCRTQKEKRFQAFRIINSKPIGHLSWTLRRLQ